MAELNLAGEAWSNSTNLHQNLRMIISIKERQQQAAINSFYAKHGPCCAGCDSWRWVNSVVGECIKTAPVSGAERVAMLGMTGVSLQIGSGQIMTPRDHLCGQFSDSE